MAMDFKANVSVNGSEEALSRLVEVLEVLLAERPPEDLGAAHEVNWLARLPQWLVDSFSEKKSDKEAESWLRRWRRSSLEKRADMEEEAGWEFIEWIFWFSEGNEAWRINGFRRLEASKVSIFLSSADIYLPSRALEWLISVSGAEVTSIRVNSEE
ncbi:hypothetical protein ACIOTI_32240 [Streptomyces sp. NPDC087843]|uniref:hypothetical protein n=1 Tax=Streptomyces sp. NPDC087843 TaxID=3365804 RepID=UPI0038013829